MRSLPVCARLSTHSTSFFKSFFFFLQKIQGCTTFLDIPWKSSSSAGGHVHVCVQKQRWLQENCSYLHESLNLQIHALFCVATIQPAFKKGLIQFETGVRTDPLIPEEHYST
ncbi:hypothetical protein FQA47_017508 [Oryzias melastigma]|uniref:Uncharacterized protein n=1 Tax=Oryzias melastigma TaxID=30732 RepID=A0A834FMS6_ORYME|nr:hypothetical protein FQA47_017508 [Oryzias melastigma]